MSELDKRLEKATQDLRDLDEKVVTDLTKIITHQEGEGENSFRYIIGTDSNGPYFQSSKYTTIKASISTNFYNLLQKCPVIGSTK